MSHDLDFLALEGVSLDPRFLLLILALSDWASWLNPKNKSQNFSIYRCFGERQWIFWSPGRALLLSHFFLALRTLWLGLILGVFDFMVREMYRARVILLVFLFYFSSEASLSMIRVLIINDSGWICVILLVWSFILILLLAWNLGFLGFRLQVFVYHSHWYSVTLLRRLLFGFLFWNPDFLSHNVEVIELAFWQLILLSHHNAIIIILPDPHILLPLCFLQLPRNPFDGGSRTAFCCS
jgi:hypothetical protein